MPRWFKIRELQDLKMIVAQSVVVVMLVAFLGDLLEWEQGSDIAFVGGGVAAVIAAIAFTLRSSHADAPELARRDRADQAIGCGRQADPDRQSTRSRSRDKGATRRARPPPSPARCGTP